MHSVKKMQVQFHVALHFSIKNFTIHQNVPYSFKRKKLYRLASLHNGRFCLKNPETEMYVTWVTALLLNNCTTKNATMVFCYQNCSSDREKLLKFEAEAQEFEITRTIYSNSERSEQFLVTECFFNLFLEVSHI